MFVVQIGQDSASVHAYILKLNKSFDVTLGEDWCKANGVDSLYTQGCLTTSHRLSSVGVAALCPIVGVMLLKQQLAPGDKLFLVNLNAVSREIPDATKIIWCSTYSV